MTTKKEKVVTVMNTNNRGRKKAVKLPDDYQTLDKVVEKVERDYILKTLELTNWNLQKTSRVLDIARNTLKAKIKKYDIQ
ncbi:MAG TPA: helix-turn-helix domain-containing protein [Spirochaetota bacterium]|nr:helix-turn-helix domain-containing protein [Spirochaetota bacterium]